MAETKNTTFILSNTECEDLLELLDVFESQCKQAENSPIISKLVEDKRRRMHNLRCAIYELLNPDHVDVGC